MNYFKKLVGQRIYLSPINPEDYEKFTEWLNDNEVVAGLLLDTKIITLKTEKEALERLAGGEYVFSIIDQTNNELIGNCGFHNLSLIDRKAELGIFIGNKNYWNQGYGTEAVKLLLKYGFEKLNLNSVMLVVFSFNKGAIKCYEKVGFKLIGSRREARIVNEIKYDEVFMDILRTEFKD